MIDEEDLARLVRQSIERIEIPADGVERVLAARDALVPSRARPTGQPAAWRWSWPCRSASPR